MLDLSTQSARWWTPPPEKVMQNPSIREDRKAAMDAARRRLARLKLASVTASMMAMGGLTSLVSLQASAATVASSATQVVSSAAQATAAQAPAQSGATSAATATATASPTPAASSAPAIVSAQS
jgi:hypothetical protein